MENQHRKITGYRELSQEEINLMNEIKETGEKLRELSAKVGAHIAGQSKACFESQKSDEFNRLEAADPWMWHTEGTKQLQIGIMQLVRAVAQPTTF